MNIEPYLHEQKTVSQLQAMTPEELRHEAEIAQHDHDVIYGWWAGLVENFDFVEKEELQKAIYLNLDLAKGKETDAVKYYALVRDTYLSKIAFPTLQNVRTDAVCYACSNCGFPVVRIPPDENHPIE